MPTCIVRKCAMARSKAGEKRKVVLHVFPTNINRIKAWLQQTGQEYKCLDAFVQSILDDKKKEIFRMCSGHFTEDCYEIRGNKKFLKENAVPTIFPDTFGGPVIREYVHKRSVKRPCTTDLSQPISTEAPRVSSFTTAASTCQWFMRSTREASTQTDSERIYEENAIKRTNSSLRFPCINTTYSEHFRSQKRKRDVIENSICEYFEDVPPSTSQASSLKRTQCSVRLPSGDPDCSAQMFEPEKSEIAIEEAKETDYVNERKFIVFESCLDNLFKRTFCTARKDCTARVERVKKICEGSFLKVIGYCPFGHQFDLFESQPRLNNVAIGDVLSAASLLFSGANFRKVHEQKNIFGLQQMSEPTYSHYQRSHLYGVIDYYWQLEQQRIKNEKKDEPLCVVGDGQWYSPGYMTKCHIYTIMDIKTEEILDFEIVQCRPSTSSVVMEKKAIQICLNRLKSNKYNIKVVATDSHVSIRKLMREKYPDLLHQFDVWHYAKSLEKKLKAISKKKSGRDIVPWIKSIINHFWWSMRTCGSDEKVLYERWTSVLWHVTDQHSWQKAAKYHECSHPPLTAKQQASVRWMRKSSPAFENLYNFVMDAQMKKDIVYLVNFWHIGSIEVYHSLMRKYQTKQIPFRMDSMLAMTKLGVLAQNHNVQKKAETVTTEAVGGSGQSKRAFLKSSRRWVVRADNKPVSIAHLEGMLQDVLCCC